MPSGFERQFAEINSAVSGQPGWWLTVAATVPNPAGTPQPGALTLACNPRLKYRRFYAYLFAGTSADQLSWFRAQISLYLDDQPIMIFPFSYTYKSSSNAGTSLLTEMSGPLPGSSIVPGTISFSLNHPNTGSVGAPNDAETTPISIVPLPFTDIRCQRMDLDLLQWGGSFSPTKFRAIIATVGWEEAPMNIKPGQAQSVIASAQ